MKNIQLMSLLNKFPFLDFPASSWAMLYIKHKIRHCLFKLHNYCTVLLFSENAGIICKLYRSLIDDNKDISHVVALFCFFLFWSFNCRSKL